MVFRRKSKLELAGGPSRRSRNPRQKIDKGMGRKE
jgi:hypothetical protein